MKHEALQLYDYHVWANNKFFGRLKELPQEIYDQKMQSVFPSIADVLAHIFVTDTIYLSVIRGDNMDDTQAAITETQQKIKGTGLGEMEALFHDLEEQYQTFFNTVGDMEQPITVEHPHFGKLDTRLCEMVQHVVNHGTYHRGNLTAMIRQQGSPSVPTDYIMYLYEKQATN
ncbi:DinB family protein [Lederbergia sp. NSJ-179]|uniref:DinB family protein n=1 Tax=Lederbergia sp. NSJ-179 TaxID=2931402 RepID=UPI001FD5953B|nr:DinB family protein [Lederbergia sp. NSJ-179]MCJ7842961.1 DinB family protein [Lederbergia sp. NSJ-179]